MRTNINRTNLYIISCLSPTSRPRPVLYRHPHTRGAISVSVFVFSWVFFFLILPVILYTFVFRVRWIFACVIECTELRRYIVSETDGDPPVNRWQRLAASVPADYRTNRRSRGAFLFYLFSFKVHEYYFLFFPLTRSKVIVYIYIYIL